MVLTKEFEAIHIFDSETNVIAVFRADNGNFVTTCELNGLEKEELKSTSNFGGRKGWFSGEVKNIPPINVVPPANNFENDVQQITPVDNLQIDNNDLTDINK